MMYVLSDESLNSKGFRVMTAGIDMDSRFMKNPVILYDHNGHVLSVGKMKIWKDNDKLMGEPEWDVDDKLGAELSRKYEKGYMNAFSIGIDPTELSDNPDLLLPGQYRMTVSKSELIEISATNIPSNKNAVKLSNSENDEVPFLTQKEKNMKKICLKFGLPEDSTEDVVVERLSVLIQEKEELSSQNILLKAENERLITTISEKEEVELNTILDNPDKKLTVNQKENFRKLAKTDRNAVIELVNAIPDYKKLSDVPNSGNKDDQRLNLSFDELHKKHPAFLQELKENSPEVYKEKYKAKFGVDPK